MEGGGVIQRQILIWGARGTVKISHSAVLKMKKKKKNKRNKNKCVVAQLILDETYSTNHWNSQGAQWKYVLDLGYEAAATGTSYCLLEILPCPAQGPEGRAFTGGCMLDSQDFSCSGMSWLGILTVEWNENIRFVSCSFFARQPSRYQPSLNRRPWRLIYAFHKLRKMVIRPEDVCGTSACAFTWPVWQFHFAYLHICACGFFSR